MAAAAVDLGVCASLSLPLVVAGEGIGALNVYGTRPGQFSHDDEEYGEVFATQAAVALANAQAYWEQAELAAGLSSAMKSRATIEQAKGILIATTGCSPEEAFDRLREQSQFENRKLRDVAEDLVGSKRLAGDQR